MKKEDIQKQINEFLEKLQVDAQAEVNEEGETFNINITGGDNKLLIGWKGQHLQALEHLIKVLVNRNSEGQFKLVVDVGGYKRYRDNYLIQVIRKAIKFVTQSQKPFTLDPMDARSRRLVHVECSNYPELESESVGEGSSRRVKISYKER